MIWAILLASPVYAQQTVSQPDVCFSADVASQIVVDLERAKIMQQQVDILEKQNVQLEKQIDLLKQISSLQRERSDVAMQTVEEYKKLMKDKDELCEQKIKDAKPTLVQTVVQTSLLVAIGVALGALLF
jgi:predicted transcriptional regulator